MSDTLIWWRSNLNTKIPLSKPIICKKRSQFLKGNFSISTYFASQHPCKNIDALNSYQKEIHRQGISYKIRQTAGFSFSCAFALCVFTAVAFVVFSPIKQAHAGLFSDLVGYFIGGASADETPITPASVSLPLLGSNPSSPMTHGAEDELNEDNLIVTTQGNAIIASRNPLGTLSAVQDTIVVYKIQPGDTLSGIAAHFAVSVNTILWANNIRDAKTIKIGDELVILPVTGIQYKVKKGDTLESIVKKFKPKNEDIAHEDFLAEIVSFNGLAVGDALEVDSAIIIPEGEFTSPAPISPRPGTKPVPSISARFAQYPEYKGYYLRPIIGGRRSRGAHGYNGVDLANSCGFPLLASAAGSVIVARNSGWNGGYGKYVVIAHPNGTQTLYAHMQAIAVSVGQTIMQGFQIGQIGSTGNSTGCHVHFEIRGARNPF